MHTFYCSQINLPVHEINEKESSHISKVLRLSKGSEILLTDGKGNLYKAEIIGKNGKNIVVEIKTHIENYGKRPYYLHIAIAPTKNIDRTEWFVEKATEIGIDEITPIICKNSERKIIKTERLIRIAEAALKQSQKAYLPKINDQIDFSKFFKSNIQISNKFIAHCYEDFKREFLGKLIKKNTHALVLIGPEGDFNKDEVIIAEQNGFLGINLGNNRLRTETAGIVACDVISLINHL